MEPGGARTRRRQIRSGLIVLAVFAAVAAMVAIWPGSASILDRAGTALIVLGLLLMGAGLIARTRRRRARG
ncbi:LPXTG cell wall anchor domain-containing protein [Micromonospora sp. NPDC049282]|uniref:LPXTG cell wall anchor domain-containing protein n=1 Tax=Micromonospora sp. NPDC049282 TaxID=3364269 RepID=UPI00371E909C